MADFLQPQFPKEPPLQSPGFFGLENTTAEALALFPARGARGAIVIIKKLAGLAVGETVGEAVVGTALPAIITPANKAIGLLEKKLAGIPEKNSEKDRPLFDFAEVFEPIGDQLNKVFTTKAERDAEFRAHQRFELSFSLQQRRDLLTQIEEATREETPEAFGLLFKARDLFQVNPNTFDLVPPNLREQRRLERPVGSAAPSGLGPDFDAINEQLHRRLVARVQTQQAKAEAAAWPNETGGQYPSWLTDPC